MSGVFIRVAGDVRVACAPDLRSMTTFVLLEQEDWFEDEMAFVRRLVRPGMHALDIGANHGIYSLNVAKLLGESGRVWSFEPTSLPHGLLSRSIEENGLAKRIVLSRLGLSNTARTATMYVSQNSELNSLHQGPHTGAAATESIELDRLDDALARLAPGVPIDFVKLDAEGEEARILEGGEQFFREQSPIVMFEVKHGETWNTDLVARFRERGFACYRLLPGLGALVPAEAPEHFDAYLLNLFALKPDAARRLAERGALVMDESGTRVPTLPAFDWRSAIGEWSRALRPHWESGIATRSRLAATQLPALGHLLASELESVPILARKSHLDEALRLWRSLGESEAGHPSIVVSRARAELAAGGRMKAVSSLNALVTRGSALRQGEFDLPFLPPDSRFDSRLAQGTVWDWMQAAILETLERKVRFSTFFDPSAVTRLEAYAGNPNFTLETRKRLALAGWVAGKHVRIPGGRALIEAGPENRNPELWKRLVETGSL